jgi:hypothetical protein
MQQRIDKLKQEEKLDNEKFEREISVLYKEQEEHERWMKTR